MQDIISKVKNAFNFEVAKVKWGPTNADSAGWKNDDNCFRLHRNDSGEVVSPNSVTTRYVPHTTDDVVALVEAAQAAFDNDVDCLNHFNNGHYVSIQPNKEHRLSVYGQSDNVWPRVLIRAGYDGRAFSATIGYYRDVCRNMAMMRLVSGTTVSIRHTNSLRDRMDELVATFNTLKESWGTLSATIERLESKQVRMDNFLSQIYGEPDENSQRSQSIHRNRTTAIWTRLNRERNFTGRPTMQNEVSLWEAFNGVQGYHQYERQQEMFANAIRASEVPHVKRAEKLALELAA